MKSKLVFILLVVAQGTLAYILLSGQTLSAPWIWGITCLMLILTFLLYRIISKSVNAVQTGMSLLREQDFNSSLVTVGQPEVDRIVKLFNSLMEQLKNERLRFLEQSNFHKLVMDASPLGITILDFDGKRGFPFQRLDKTAGLLRLHALRTVRIQRKSADDPESVPPFGKSYHRPYVLFEVSRTEIGVRRDGVFSERVGKGNADAFITDVKCDNRFHNGIITQSYMKVNKLNVNLVWFLNV